VLVRNLPRFLLNAFQGTRSCFVAVQSMSLLRNVCSRRMSQPDCGLKDALMGDLSALGGRRDLTDIDSQRQLCRRFPGSKFEVVVIVAVRIAIGGICWCVAAGGKFRSSFSCIHPNLTRATALRQASRPIEVYV
jgi:hypothetical protein